MYYNYTMNISFKRADAFQSLEIQVVSAYGLTVIFFLQGHSDWVTDVDFSRDGNWILSSSKDKTIRLWNIENSDSIPSVMENKRSMGLKIVKVRSWLIGWMW